MRAGGAAVLAISQSPNSPSSLGGGPFDPGVRRLGGLGRVEGRIVRRSQTWFAVDITATPRKLEKLANMIDCLVERETRGGYRDQGATPRAFYA